MGPIPQLYFLVLNEILKIICGHPLSASVYSGENRYLMKVRITVIGRYLIGFNQNQVSLLNQVLIGLSSSVFCFSHNLTRTLIVKRLWESNDQERLKG